jgi:uncharacterized protein YecE (DUF72 family)
MIKLGMCGFTIAVPRYIKQFPVVEVQQTFYDPPPAPTIAGWRARVPADFEFTMKAWQLITHRSSSSTYRRVRRPLTDRERAEAGGFRWNDTTKAAFDTTLVAQELLRATVILFQCPASFKATEENVDAMHGFFGAIHRPRGVRLAWEPRGPWPDELVRSLCAELQLVHAVDPFVRPSLTPELLYWRLHGNGSAYASYTDNELQQVVDWLRAAQATDAYVLFNNVPRVKDIDRFLQILAAGAPCAASPES